MVKPLKLFDEWLHRRNEIHQAFTGTIIAKLWHKVMGK